LLSGAANRSVKAAFKCLAVLLVATLIVGLDFGIKKVYKKLRKPPVKPVAEHREPSPYYHHGLRPNAAVMDTFGDRQYPFFSNSLGMRDVSIREVSARKTRPRLLLIGDSFTEGVGLPWEKTFAGLLAAGLEKAGVEVLNSGVNSYCPILIQGRLRYLFEQRGFEVDRVIVLVDISDVMQELIYRKTPDGRIEAQPLFSSTDAQEISTYIRNESWIQEKLEENFVILGAVGRNFRLWRRRPFVGRMRFPVGLSIGRNTAVPMKT